MPTQLNLCPLVINAPPVTSERSGSSCRVGSSPSSGWCSSSRLPVRLRGLRGPAAAATALAVVVDGAGSACMGGRSVWMIARQSVHFSHAVSVHLAHVAACSIRPAARLQEGLWTAEVLCNIHRGTEVNFTFGAGADMSMDGRTDSSSTQ
jgi:hypothetical protein